MQNKAKEAILSKNKPNWLIFLILIKVIEIRTIKHKAKKTVRQKPVKQKEALREKNLQHKKSVRQKKPLDKISIGQNTIK